jgi:hypothetical protein
VAAVLVAVPDQVADFALLDRAVGEPEFVRPDLGEDDATDGGIDDPAGGVAVDRFAAESRGWRADAVVGAEVAFEVGEDDLVLGAEELVAFAVLLGEARFGGEVVAAQGDVLGGGHDGFAARRAEDVERGHHEEAGLHLGFDGERDVHGHLVAVEVRVVGGTNEGMDADRLAFDEHRLERLDGEAVERGGAVEEDGVALGDFLEDVPDLGDLALDHLLGRADGMDEAAFLEFADDERLEQHEGHLLGKAALVELEFGADDDDRTAGVIDALAEQVLAEAAALALEHVGERLEGAVAGAGDGAAVAAVVEEGVDRLLEHPLFVADDDLRGLELEEVLEAVVAVDDAAVEVVQVGGGEAAAFERDEGAEVRGDDRGGP